MKLEAGQSDDNRVCIMSQTCIPSPNEEKYFQFHLVWKTHSYLLVQSTTDEAKQLLQLLFK